jgi:hypothetical protein
VIPRTFVGRFTVKNGCYLEKWEVGDRTGLLFKMERGKCRVVLAKGSDRDAYLRPAPPSMPSFEGWKTCNLVLSQLPPTGFFVKNPFVARLWRNESVACG